MAEPHSPSSADVYTMLGLSPGHNNSRASTILDLPSDNRNSKTSSILDISKAYKFFTLKWHHDHSHKLEVNHSTHEAAKESNHEKNHERVSSGDDATTPWEANDPPFHQHHNRSGSGSSISIDDSFVHRRSSSLLSKSASRRSHTPTPSSFSRTSSRRSNSVADFFSLGSLSRSASRNAGHWTSEPPEAAGATPVNASSRSTSSKTLTRMMSNAGRGSSLAPEGLTSPTDASRSASTSRTPTRTTSSVRRGSSPEAPERAAASRSTSTSRTSTRTMSRTTSSVRRGSSPEASEQATATRSTSTSRRPTRMMSRTTSSVKRGNAATPTVPSEAPEKATISTTPSRSTSTSRTPTRTMSRTMSSVRRGSTSETTERATTPTSASRSTSSARTTPTRSMSRTSSNVRIVYSQTAAKKKPQPIEMKLKCTLEELLSGCIMKVTVTRDVLSETGVIQEEETLKINVQPGWRKGTKILFEGKGDEKPGYLPADIVFVIEEKGHPLFKRRGDDLETTVEVSLVQALTGCTLSVPLLGGEQMALSLEETLYPGYERAILGQGMPCTKDPSRRGELRITFYVEFPLRLSEERRLEIYNILSQCDSP